LCADEYARTIEANGLTREIPEEDIFPFFESRKYGNLYVEKIRRISDDTVLVTFKDEEGKDH